MRGYRQNAPKPMSRAAIRKQIRQYMVDLQIDDDEFYEFFKKSEIDMFINVAVSNNLTPSEIDEALDQYLKGYGEFYFND